MIPDPDLLAYGYGPSIGPIGPDPVSILIPLFLLLWIVWWVMWVLALSCEED